MLTATSVEFATLTLDPETKKPRSKIYRPAEVDALLEKHGLAKKEDVEMK
jgi:20S proteasome subunit alpha 3